jgi:sulfate adenylyltransferase subunit 1
MKRDAVDLDVADRGVLRFITCGSVDDGKSTLIGRLLYDTKALLADTLATLVRHAERRGLAAPDLSLLTDGLTAEREQGITIDVAYRYFATARRKFIIADCPGHEQYTRNMVTAASTADVAVLLVDARKGVLPQTRRHATLAALLGIRQVIVAVNKMDLVGFDAVRFEAIRADFLGWLGGQRSLGLDVRCVPISATDGDNIVEPSARTAWYAGPTLIRLLEQADGSQPDADAPLRFPVQWVCRPDPAPVAPHASAPGRAKAAARGEAGRGYAGRVESGTLSVGDEVVVLPGGLRSTVAAISLGTHALQTAIAGESVLVTLADERDISRGDLLVRADEPAPPLRRELTATLCWLSTTPLAPARTYVLRHTTRAVKARVAALEGRIDVNAAAALSVLPGTPAAGGLRPVVLNDIVRLRLHVQQPLAADAYRASRSTGSFILVDEATNDTVAAGIVE